MPKELLPIVDKPLIQYAAEEAIAAGIDTLIFVTGRNKCAIEDHFDNNQELEMALRAKGKYDQAEMVKNILPAGVECIFVRQPEQLGLGHAVLCAERVVGDDPFVVLLADDFLMRDSSDQQETTTHKAYNATFRYIEAIGGKAAGSKSYLFSANRITSKRLRAHRWEDAGGATLLTQNNVNGTRTINNLCAGTYTVTVTDANNCIAVASIIVTAPPAIIVTASSTNSFCVTPYTATVSSTATC